MIIFMFNKIKLFMNQLRKSILSQEQLVASKRRFGLFSQPPPIAIGDDSKYQRTKHDKGQNGKPMTNPPQMLGGSCKSGMTKSSYFQVPESIYIKDEYIDKFKVERQFDKKLHSKASFHQRDFIPASGESILSKPTYTYREQGAPKRRSLQLDEATGKVKTGIPNFSTNSTSKVQAELFKNPQYIIDPYERKEDYEKNYKKQSDKKIIHQEQMFRSMSHGSKLFSKDLLIYGGDNKAKQMLEQKKTRRSMSELNVFKHETKFSPSKASHGDPIGKYPQYISRKTIIKIKGREEVKGVSDRQEWRKGTKAYSKPSPSISLIFKNLNMGRRK